MLDGLLAHSVALVRAIGCFGQSPRNTFFWRLPYSQELNVKSCYIWRGMYACIHWYSTEDWRIWWQGQGWVVADKYLNLASCWKFDKKSTDQTITQKIVTCFIRNIHISNAIFFQYSAFWFLYCFLFIFCSFSWTCQYFKRFYLNTNLDYAGHHTRNPSFWTRLEADDASNIKNVTKTMKTGRWGWDSTSAPHV